MQDKEDRKSFSYEELEQYFNEIPRFTVKHRLEDTKRALAVLLESKEKGFSSKDKKIIHVAGTNGKGSVCAYLCSVLIEAGYRVGMFTSPHLVEMRERFRINREPVSRERFVWAFQRVMEQLETMREAVGQPDYYPTYFELLFLMGMLIFEQKNVEYIILETGLGGRLDATNAVENPILTVITEIGFDHMQYLGDTIEKIAGEKAGILKPGVPVVFCDKRREASDVIRKRAEMLGNKAVAVSGEECLHRNLTNKSIAFSVYSRYYDYIRLKLATRALYQAENAVLALRAIEELPDVSKISKKQIETGMEKTLWEGRMEEILPGIYLDGAHNEDGIEAFVQTVEAYECSGKRYLLFSAVGDKDYETVIDRLNRHKLFDQVVVTGIHDSRGADPELLRRLFMGYGEASPICIYKEKVKDALEDLLALKQEEDDIYIVGSLYLAGEIKAIVRRKTDD